MCTGIYRDYTFVPYSIFKGADLQMEIEKNRNVLMLMVLESEIVTLILYQIYDSNILS